MYWKIFFLKCCSNIEICFTITRLFFYNIYIHYYYPTKHCAFQCQHLSGTIFASILCSDALKSIIFNIQLSLFCAAFLSNNVKYIFFQKQAIKKYHACPIHFGFTSSSGDFKVIINFIYLCIIFFVNMKCEKYLLVIK